MNLPALFAAATVAVTAVFAPTNWMEAELPSIDPNGYGTWVFENHGPWGLSDGDTVWIDPDLPEEWRHSVLLHEYSHVLQARAGIYNAYGKSPYPMEDIESMADCMALLQGAALVNYGCNPALDGVAADILAGAS